jgi:hypothetical protein
VPLGDKASFSAYPTWYVTNKTACRHTAPLSRHDWWNQTGGADGQARNTTAGNGPKNVPAPHLIPPPLSPVPSGCTSMQLGPMGPRQRGRSIARSEIDSGFSTVAEVPKSRGRSAALVQFASPVCQSLLCAECRLPHCMSGLFFESASMFASQPPCIAYRAECTSRLWGARCGAEGDSWGSALMPARDDQPLS